MKNMKKLVVITVFALTGSFVFAGDGENELKNFRFGLKVTPSVNWYKPEGKILSPNGAGVKFGGGLILEFRLAKVASFQTGLQIDLDGGKIKYNNGGYNTPGANTASYYYNKADDAIAKYGARPGDAAAAAKFDDEHTHYQLNERQYKASYVTIPLALKLKTKEIGMMTYFGQFGLNSSFRWKVRANDELTVLDIGASTKNESKSNIDITKDAAFFAASLNFGAGVEVNLSGSTSVLLGLNYNLGFTNVVKSKSDYIERKLNDASGSGTLSQLPQTIKGNAVLLTVGVLF
jgi:hypothetical protein